MPVRLKDIARELSVSTVTVSKALRGHSDISAETRRRVREKVEEMGYHPNWVARSLATRRTYLIGLIVPHMRHSYFQEVYDAAAAEIGPKDYSVLISVSNGDPAAEGRLIESMIARQVEGLIIASVRPPEDVEEFERLNRRGVRYVLIDRRFDGLAADFVGLDDERLGRMATEHLIALGRRRIAHIRGPRSSVGDGRFRGYQAALAAHGLSVADSYVCRGEVDESSARESMSELLSLEAPPDAVFCYCDPVAAGAIKACLAQGFRVPEDVAVIGAGNMRYSDLLLVPLSTVDQNSAEVGRRAARNLLRRIEAKSEPAPSEVLLAPRLVKRQSTAR